MIDLTKYIDPRNWLWWALGVVAILAGAWFGVINPYNNWITAKAVQANDKLWADKFKQNTQDLKSLGQQFIDLNAKVVKDRGEVNKKTAETLNKEKDRADKATQKYLAAIKLQNQISAERDDLVTANVDLLARLRDTAKPLAIRDGDSVEIRRLSEYAEGLGELHEKCERSLAAVRRTGATAVDRAAEAEAGIRALKVEP